jgi:uracil-DNA glycosylase family protein
MKPPPRTAAPLIPPQPTPESLREAAACCRACPLWKHATRTVFGEGPPRARLMFVGALPGDKEDLLGRPFMGPAGAVLDVALSQAGLERDAVYITNAVKHFKWKPAGKKRLLQKPNALEEAACRPWLDAELAAVEPALVVCLGAAAARQLLGRGFRVSRDRGRIIAARAPLGPMYLVTVHPAAVLRASDDETRRREFALFVEDIKLAAAALRAPSRARAGPAYARSRRSPARFARAPRPSARRFHVPSRAIPYQYYD